MAGLSIGDRRLVAVLLEQKYITDDDFQKILERHSEIGGRLTDAFIDAGMISEKRIAKAIEESMGIPLVDLTAIPIGAEVLQLIDAATAHENMAVPYALDESQELLRVAFIDPLNTLYLENLEDMTGYTIEPYQALRLHFNWALATYYPELGLVAPNLDTQTDPEYQTVGQLLVSRKLITSQQLQDALEKQKLSSDPLGQILVQIGAIQQDQLYSILAEQAGVPYFPKLSNMTPTDEVSAYLLRGDALRIQAVPIGMKDNILTVAVSDQRKRDDLAKIVGHAVQLVLAPPSEIEAAIERIYPDKARVGEALLKQGVVGREQLREAMQHQKKSGRNKPLGEVLVELGFANAEDVEKALAKQRAGGGRLEDTLVQSGKINPEMLAKSLAAQLGYEYFNSNEKAPDAAVIPLIPEATARRYVLFPLRLEGKQLVVAMKDPRHVFAIDDLRLMTGREIVPAVATEKDIVALIDRNYGGTDMSALNKELSAQIKSRDNTKEEKDGGLDSLDDNAVVRVVDTIIREATLVDTSDIHIEPTPTDLVVRFRVDGALREYMKLPKASNQSISARLKIMGGLDIAERRVPQDGRVRFKKGNIDVDLRLSTLPVVYGEKLVMRILKRATSIPDIEQLGFGEYNYQRLVDVIEKPYGVFLITGPTGSGKSFSTFGILKRIARPDVNVTTVEDPVEYEIPGINQTQVNNAAGLTFARALRAFLRQDPDIIMIGEIRDTETAKIAVEAALTGHMVIATLHTNDAPGAVTRLEEMGVEGFNIAAALSGVLAQRLVRRICKNCKVETTADPNTLRLLGLTNEQIEGAVLYKGEGCEKCAGTGYKGRMAIHELMVVDDHLREGMIKGKASAELKVIGEQKSGMRTLRTDGLEKALAGMTTLEEILGSTAD